MNRALMSGFYTSDGQTFLCALQAVAAHARISEDQALTTITQSYRNTLETALEAIYRFPLPHDAVITKFSARIGETEAEGKLFEREQAIKQYQKALNAGDSAMLLENNSPDVFDIAVGNIAPGEEASVTIEYWQNLKTVDKRCRYALPLVLAPRYLPERFSSLGASILPNLGPADYRLSFTAALDFGSNYAGVTSPSHDLAVTRNTAGQPTASLTSPTLLDSDLILDIALHREADDGGYLAEEGPDGNFLWLKFTVDTEIQKENEPREYVFVLDASGSMSGGKLTQAKRALSLCLRNLMAGDRFSLIAFGSNYKVFSQCCVPYNQRNLDAAEKWLKAVADLGGTEIYQPLNHIFSMDGFGLEREVLLFTDGEVGNEQEIIELVKAHSAHTRVFPFGIDTAVNRSFIDGLAAAGNGQPEYIYPGERIDDKVLRQFARISEAVLTGLRLEGAADAGGAAVNGSANGSVNLHNAAPAAGFPPLLYTGEAYAFCFNLGFRPIPETITVSGNVEGQAYQRIYTLGHTIDWRGLSKRWAKQRIAYLQEQSADGYWKKRDKRTQEIIDTSLQYGVVSAHTAYLTQIERKDKLTGERRSEIIPTALPSLWEESDAYMLSRTAPHPPGAFGGAAPSPAFALPIVNSHSHAANPAKKVSRTMTRHKRYSDSADWSDTGPADSFERESMFYEASASVSDNTENELDRIIKTAALGQKADGSTGAAEDAVQNTAYFVIGMLLSGQFAPYRNQIRKAVSWLLANAADSDGVWVALALQLAAAKKMADKKKFTEWADRLAATLSDSDRKTLEQARAGCWHEAFQLSHKDYSDDSALAVWVLEKLKTRI